jgi:leucine dehydrogenase
LIASATGDLWQLRRFWQLCESSSRFVESKVVLYREKSMQITELFIPGYEIVLQGSDPEAGYRGIVAVHHTALGPAVGGTRYWSYPGDDEALNDALRLARGMTYKNALAGLPFGGGKSVIVRNGDRPLAGAAREKLFRAHGKLVEDLGGQYITAEDVGTGPADMESILTETKHVAGLAARAGDPSPWTARGVFRAMQAAAKHRWGSDDLAGKTVAIQGCGHVGYYLARELHEAGCKLLVSDVSASNLQRVVKEFDAKPIPTWEIYRAPADIFAPCALGGILDGKAIPQLQAAIVAGAANNQLLAPDDGDRLQDRGILYAPDYAANAGGVIYGCSVELLGWEPARAVERLNSAIYDTLLGIFEIAGAEKIPTYRAADRLAEDRLAQGAIRS